MYNRVLGSLWAKREKNPAFRGIMFYSIGFSCKQKILYIFLDEQGFMVEEGLVGLSWLFSYPQIFLVAGVRVLIALLSTVTYTLCSEKLRKIVLRPWMKSLNLMLLALFELWFRSSFPLVTDNALHLLLALGNSMWRLSFDHESLTSWDS